MPLTESSSPRVRRPLRAVSGVAGLLLASIALSGCIAIKSETATQRLPGVVTLSVMLCVSDRDHSTYTACVPGPGNTVAINTAENDNGLEGDQSGSGRGQILVGYRVPDGTVAPDSFQSQGGNVNFAKSPTYTSNLKSSYPPPAGFHWEGYISTERPFDPTVASDRETTFSPEFGLPPGAAGAPFAGQFRWRVIAGFRRTTDSGAASPGDPVSCIGFTNICFDSGVANVSTHLNKPVSDFGVLAAPATTAGQGETATLSFPVRNVDAAGLGGRTVSLSATTTVPSAVPALAATTLSVPANGSPNAPVNVSVPPGTPLGTYDVTLTASDNSSPAGPVVTRSNTAKLTVVDKLAPAIRISSPPAGATLTQRQLVVADYGCADQANGSGVATCAGPVAPGAAVDTSTVGPHSFTVTSTDGAGNASTQTNTYNVVPAPVVLGAGGPTQVAFTVAFDFSAATNKATKFKSLQVKNVPAGATVAVTCKGKGCPTQKVKGKRTIIAFTKKNAFDVVALKPWAKKSLRVGTVLTITVTKPGMTGMIKKLTIKPLKAPQITTSCLKPGAKTVSPCAV